MAQVHAQRALQLPGIAVEPVGLPVGGCKRLDHRQDAVENAMDEVSAHLDVHRRAALYDEICALGAQAWMTGTGVELFAELGERAQGFEVVETGNASAVEERELS